MFATVAILFVLIPASIACFYYLILIAAGLRKRDLPPSQTRFRYAVLIPAHNEDVALPASLQSLRDVGFPSDRVQVTVVADNCSDRTAETARALGARVIEREDQVLRGKGYALRRGLETILPEHPDGVLILDADCQVKPELLDVLDRQFAAGTEVVQVGVVTRNADDGPTGLIGAVGNAFDNLLSAGKDRLGFAVPLRGSGMAFRRSVLERFPWDSYGLTEDAEYSDRLREAGVRVRFEAEPLVRSESPARSSDLYQQRRRWRAAIFGRSGLLFNWLESKPLVLAQLVAAGVVVFACDSEPAFTIWYLSLIALTIALYSCVLFHVGLNANRLRNIVKTPWIVGRLAFVTIGGLLGKPLDWQRTRRAAESGV